jgi:hypothetical protein
MKKIESIGAALRDLIGERKIIARCELLNRIYDLVARANLSTEEREELHRLVGDTGAPGIFANILSGTPIFFDLPKLDTYTTIGGRIFHFVHTEKYSRQDFDNAWRQFQESEDELRSLLKKNLERLMVGFMAGAGYHLEPGSGPSITFKAPGREVNAQIYTGIRNIDIRPCRPEDSADCVVLVPSSENLEPFVSFFRERGQEAEEVGIQIWVANLEKGTIDPFIGYTTDMDIYKQFNNPRLAATVRSIWGRGETLPDE